MRPVAAGAARGVAAVTTLIQSLHFAATPVDPAAYVVATAVDPLVALRNE